MKILLSPSLINHIDGIYVLLHSANARVPSRLDYLVNRVASEHECKWSLSGPSPSASSKVEGAVQQRYSYPKGRAEYSNTKGVGFFARVIMFYHPPIMHLSILSPHPYLGFIVDHS